MSGTGTPGATARHEIANVLHTYTDIADRKDVAAAVGLLARARVRFPADGFDEPAAAAPFFTRLWASPVPHRHDVSNLIVEPGTRAGRWVARAHYTRWLLAPVPRPHTLGEYELTVAEPAAAEPEWRIAALTVTRTWTEGGG
ncbi:nuclear transport factor 2 family protein [Streptomyces ziwulingensis]|uniref:nuclear transport factor 2 family protein n=1 Tax=Streptomyces ziwulingensis TaxID=1045501 RepID=UPI0031EDD1D0